MNTPPTDSQTLNYYLLRTEDSEPEGPFTATILQRMFKEGDLLGAEFVATEGSEEWEVMASFLERVFPKQKPAPRSATEVDPFWIIDGANSRGPFTIGQLRKQWDAGALTLLTNFRVEPDDEERPLSIIRHLLEPPAPKPQPQPMPQQQIQIVQIQGPTKSRGAYVALALLVGGLGVHNLYAGYTGRGLVQMAILITTGWMCFPLSPLCLWFWALVEAATVTADSTGRAFD